MPAAAFPDDASSAAANLRRLLHLRVIILLGEILAAVAAQMKFHAALPWDAIVAVWGALTICNIAAVARLRRRTPVRPGELFAQVMADVVLLGVLLYFTGGSANPLISLLLLPLVFAAVALPRAYTWLVTAAAVAAYSLLMIQYHPLAMHDHEFNLHLLGMWFGFVLSAGLIAFFVVRMAAAVREQERRLAAAREHALRAERLAALGTLAAGAAHELGTPLATMAVLAQELEHELAGVAGVPQQLQLLRSQVDHCKRILTGMAGAGGDARAEGGQRRRLDEYLREVLAAYARKRPEVQLAQTLEGTDEAPVVVVDRTLTQALDNVLSNAGDASPECVEVHARWTRDELVFEARDCGPGFSAEASAHAGEPFFTTKGPQGMGLGLYLARATLARLGGALELDAREGGGVCARVSLPLAALRVG